jgi:hypothetical protein
MHNTARSGSDVIRGPFWLIEFAHYAGPPSVIVSP